MLHSTPSIAIGIGVGAGNPCKKKHPWLVKLCTKTQKKVTNVQLSPTFFLSSLD